MENKNIETVDNSEIRNSKKNNLFSFDYRKVEVEEGFNCREDMGDLEALGNDIAENGQAEPVKGFRKGDVFILTDGHRRRLAIHLVNSIALSEGKEIRVPYIDCIIDASKTNPEERIFSMLRSGEDPHKKNLNRVEIANAMKRLVTQNKLTAKDIALKIGGAKKLAYVYDTLLLGDSPRYLQSLVVNGTIPPTNAIKLIKDCGGDHTEILARVAEFEKALEPTKTEEELDNQNSNENSPMSNEPSPIPLDSSMLDNAPVQDGQEGSEVNPKETIPSKEVPAVKGMVAKQSKGKKELSKEEQKAVDKKEAAKRAKDKLMGNDKTYQSLINDGILAAQEKGCLSAKSVLWEFLKMVSLSPKAVSAAEINYAILKLAKAEMLAEEATTKK